eukprot:2564428-Karenia_brevis.AAC.1
MEVRAERLHLDGIIHQVKMGVLGLRALVRSGEDATDPVVLTSILHQSLQRFQSEMQMQFQTSLASNDAHMVETLQSAFEQRFKRAEKLIAENTAEITEVKTMLHVLQSKYEALEKQIMADTSPRSESQPSYSRAPLPNIIRINLEGM